MFWFRTALGRARMKDLGTASRLSSTAGTAVFATLLFGCGACRLPQVASPARPIATPENLAQEPAGSAKDAATRVQTIQRKIPAAPLVWKSLPDSSSVLNRISFGSCSRQYQEQPIWDVIEKTEPDLFLHLGDMIYADRLPFGDLPLPKGMDVVEKARLDYAFLSAQPSFSAFVERVPFASIWDDHDLGENDAGASFPRVGEMRDLFLEFVGAGVSDPRRSHPGLYVAHAFGAPGKRVQVILVDTRTFRDDLVKDARSAEEKKAARIIGTYAPHTDRSKTLLGEEQWRWLDRQLSEPADVRIIASSIQVVASEKGIESWGNFPHERERLYELIGRRKASGVLLLSGDVHFAELSKTLEGPYPLYDFTSSNLAQHETSWGESVINSYRVRGPYSHVNFGQLDIDWERRVVKLGIRDKDGGVVFSEDVRLAELQVP